jgi:hypothetical protein
MAKKKNLKVVRANAFELINEKGKLRAALRTNGGATNFQMYDNDDEQAKIDFTVHPDGAAHLIIFHAKNFRFAVTLGANAEGGAGISVQGSDPGPIVTLGVREAPEPECDVKLYDPDGQKSASLASLARKRKRPRGSSGSTPTNGRG